MNAKLRRGVCRFLGTGAIEAASSTIGMNAKSACESEYIASSEQITNSMYLRNFSMGQGYQLPPGTVMQDDESAIKLADDGFSSACRAKDINIRYYSSKIELLADKSKISISVIVIVIDSLSNLEYQLYLVDLPVDCRHVSSSSE